MAELLFQSLLVLASPLVWLIKSDRYFRIVSASLAWCWGALNLSQGLTDSALVMFVLGVRTLTGLFLINSSLTLKSAFAALFIAFFTAALFKGFQDWFSLLPWFAACWATLCQLFLSGTRLRIFQCAGADGAWVVYDVANKVWGHLAAEIVAIGLNVFAVRKALRSSHPEKNVTP